MKKIFLKVFCNFIKKETPVQAFSCEFCEILKNTYSVEYLRRAAFVKRHYGLRTQWLRQLHCVQGVRSSNLPVIAGVSDLSIAPLNIKTKREAEVSHYSYINLCCHFFI